MYCFKCGKQISDDAGFCPYCGAKQTEEPESTKSYNTYSEESYSSGSKAPIIALVIVAILVVTGVGSFIGFKLLNKDSDEMELASTNNTINTVSTPTTNNVVKEVKLVKGRDFSGVEESEPKKLSFFNIDNKRDLMNYEAFSNLMKKYNVNLMNNEIYHVVDGVSYTSDDYIVTDKGKYKILYAQFLDDSQRKHAFECLEKYRFYFKYWFDDDIYSFVESLEEDGFEVESFEDGDGYQAFDLYNEQEKKRCLSEFQEYINTLNFSDNVNICNVCNYETLLKYILEKRDIYEEYYYDEDEYEDEVEIVENYLCYKDNQQKIIDLFKESANNMNTSNIIIGLDIEINDFQHDDGSYSVSIMEELDYDIFNNQYYGRVVKAIAKELDENASDYKDISVSMLIHNAYEDSMIDYDEEDDEDDYNEIVNENSYRGIVGITEEDVEENSDILNEDNSEEGMYYDEEEVKMITGNEVYHEDEWED